MNADWPDPAAALVRARAEHPALPLWERLPVLVRPAEAPHHAPTTPFLSGLRRCLAHRRSEPTRALFREVGLLAQARVEEVAARDLPSLFAPEEQACIVGGVFTQLFDGGLAAYRGADAEGLRQWVLETTDRALLRAAVGKWALDEVRSSWRARFRTLLSEAEAEELGADVLGELLSRSLARFEGSTPNQLYVYVRTTARRAVGKAARRAVLDRRSRDRMRAEAAPNAPPLVGRPPPPPRVRLREGSPPPISEDDQRYLEDLLAAKGRLATVAETRGVTRGSVTRMVQRILARLDALAPDERERVGEWAEETLQRLR